MSRFEHQRHVLSWRAKQGIGEDLRVRPVLPETGPGMQNWPVAKIGRGAMERNEGQPGITMDGAGRRLYVSTGFPQLVQGKRGESCGESRMSLNLFVLCRLEAITTGSCSTGRLV